MWNGSCSPIWPPQRPMMGYGVGLAAIRSEAHAVNVVDIHREGGSRNAGPAEREKLARLFGTIGNATAGSRPSRSDPRVLGSPRLTGIGTVRTTTMRPDGHRRGGSTSAP